MNVISKKLAVFLPPFFAFLSTISGFMLHGVSSCCVWKPFEYKSVKDMNTWIIRIAGALTH